MALTASKVKADSIGGVCYIYGTLTFSGSYVQISGAGEVFDPSVLPGVAQFYKCAPKLPYAVAIWGSNGYGFGLTNAGTTLAGGKIRITTASATELGAGAYPAGITGDTAIYFEVACPKA